MVQIPGLGRVTAYPKVSVSWREQSVMRRRISHKTSRRTRQIQNRARGLVRLSTVWETDEMQRREFLIRAGAAMSTVAIIPAFAQPPEALEAGMPRLKSGFAPVNSLQMYYEIHGDGEPLILLHGGVQASEAFGPNLPALAKSRQVIAVHLQGRVSETWENRSSGLFVGRWRCPPDSDPPPCVGKAADRDFGSYGTRRFIP